MENPDSLDSFTEILKKIDHPIAYLFGDNSISIFLFILGCLYSYYLYRKSKPSKRLIFYNGRNQSFSRFMVDDFVIEVTKNGKSYE